MWFHLDNVLRTRVSVWQKNTVMLIVHISACTYCKLSRSQMLHHTGCFYWCLLRKSLCLNEMLWIYAAPHPWVLFSLPEADYLWSTTHCVHNISSIHVGQFTGLSKMKTSNGQLAHQACFIFGNTDLACSQNKNFSWTTWTPVWGSDVFQISQGWLAIPSATNHSPLPPPKKKAGPLPKKGSICTSLRAVGRGRLFCMCVTCC